jgi:hypothetical protein
MERERYQHVGTARLTGGDSAALLAAISDCPVAAIAEPSGGHHGQWTGAPPRCNNIVPEKGTGAYAGRTGKATMSGWHDANKFPEQATFNDFYLIEFDPKS